MKDGTVHKAHAIVSNGDVASTYRYLIPSRYRRKYTDRDRQHAVQYVAVCALLWHQAALPDSPLLHHNLILNGSYRDLMRDIFANRPVRDDFALYLHMPSRTDPSVAPEGAKRSMCFRRCPTWLRPPTG
jgi:phytoene desaturase